MAFVEDEVEVVEQVVAEGFGVAGVGGIGDGGVEDGDAGLGAGLEGFVLFVCAAVGVDLEEAFDEEDEVGVPVGVGGEERPLAEIGDVVEGGIEEGEVGDGAGEGGELVAVGVDPEGM